MTNRRDVLKTVAALAAGGGAAGSANAGAAQTGTTDDRLLRNKKSVVAFYDLMFNQNKPELAVELYVGAEYKQHNPHVADGKQAFIDYFTQMAKDYPGKSVEFRRVIAEGNFVVLHCLQRATVNHDWVGMDIFRLDENGKIVEHWDVLQILPEKSANSNTMF